MANPARIAVWDSSGHGNARRRVYTSRRHPKLAHGLQALAAHMAWSNKRLLVVSITGHIAGGSYAYRASKAALNVVMLGLIFGNSAKIWVGS